MAKDGKNKNKIPKSVAGIKVPKKLRKAGAKAVKLAQDPIVGEVVAAALLSAAAALREGNKPKAGAGEATAAKQSANAESAAEAKRQASQLGETLKGLALDVARRALEGLDDGLRAKSGGGAARPNGNGGGARGK